MKSYTYRVLSGALGAFVAFAMLAPPAARAGLPDPSPEYSLPHLTGVPGETVSVVLNLDTDGLEAQGWSNSVRVGGSAGSGVTVSGVSNLFPVPHNTGFSVAESARRQSNVDHIAV